MKRLCSLVARATNHMRLYVFNREYRTNYNIVRKYSQDHYRVLNSLVNPQRNLPLDVQEAHDKIDYWRRKKR